MVEKATCLKMLRVFDLPQISIFTLLMVDKPGVYSNGLAFASANANAAFALAFDSFAFAFALAFYSNEFD